MWDEDLQNKKKFYLDQDNWDIIFKYNYLGMKRI